jgi:hypothetical protein
MQIIELYITAGDTIQGFNIGVSTNKLIGLPDSQFTSTVKVGAKVRNTDDDTEAFVTTVVSDTVLNLSADIFTIAYKSYVISGVLERLELFGDESVSITDSIKNVKDVAKVFTPFSQQFNVPASKHNNKIFKHYENSDILNSFDARYKVDALIKLNGADYKKGKIKLNSVSMKDNKPYAYKLIFFGETIEFKDVLAENELSSLEYPSSLNFSYTHANGLQKFTNLSEVCMPLITHTKNMRLDNNGYKSTDNTFLNFRDLKPAIKVKTIIEAIENDYPEIDFTDEFFNGEQINNLYLWMHKEKGFMANAEESEADTTTISTRFGTNPLTGWVLTADDEIRPAYISSSGGTHLTVSFVITINTASQTDEYSLFIRRASDNQIVQSFENQVGNNVFSAFMSAANYGTGNLDVYIDFVAANVLSLNTFTLGATYSSSNYGTYQFITIGSGTYTSPALTSANEIIIADHMPKMKIMDFLSNLFKMFNLVAYKQGEQIRVIPLNDFYSEGVNYDITKYVDTESSDIKKVLQYRNIKLDFKSRKSFLVQKQQELLGNIFAEESYGNDNWDGGDYKVELDFEKMLYERLSNANTGALSTICQGAMLDKDFNATIGKPLLLYIKNEATTNDFEFEDTSTSTTTTITNYNRPSQIYVQSNGVVSSGSSSLNFGVEADEFFLEPKGTNLFAKYYADYIIGVFDRQGRILTVDAYLPLHIILNYNLNDRFIIANKVYRINSIKTNLLTNKSKLELYTSTEPITQLENSQSASADRVAQVTVTTKSTDFITIGWTAVTGVVGYDVILNGGVFTTTVGTSLKVNNLQSGTTYNIGVRAKYNISGNDVYSLDTTITETTL